MEITGVSNGRNYNRKENYYSSEEEYTSDGSSEYTDNSDYDKYPSQVNDKVYRPVARKQMPQFHDAAYMTGRRKLSVASSANASQAQSSMSQVSCYKRHVGVQMTTKYILQEPSEPSIETKTICTQTDRKSSPIPEMSTIHPPIGHAIEETHVVTRNTEEPAIVEKSSRKPKKKKKEKRRIREVHRKTERPLSPEIEVHVDPETKWPIRERTPSPSVVETKRSAISNGQNVPKPKVELRESSTQHEEIGLPPKVHYIPEKPANAKINEYDRESKIEQINGIISSATTNNQYHQSDVNEIRLLHDNARSNYTYYSATSNDQRSTKGRIALTPEDLAIIKALAHERAKQEIYGYSARQQSSKSKRRPLSAVSRDQTIYYKYKLPEPREIMCENVYLERQRPPSAKYGLALPPTKKTLKKRPVSASSIPRSESQLPGIKTEKRSYRRHAKKISAVINPGRSRFYTQPTLNLIK